MTSADPRRFVEQVCEDNRRWLEDERSQGALRDLDQMFQSAWVYVAELIQNAMDEGARQIRFAVDRGRLVFEHDGRPFAEANVRGLCSKGLSTKGAGTVGFMGVGFKAVFYAYRQVIIRSGEWRFGLRVNPIAGQFGESYRDWSGAFQPVWVDEAEPPTEGMTTRFVLSERLPDLGPIAEDLNRVLQADLSLLPILSRRGLRQLEWNGITWHLSARPEGVPHSGVHSYKVTAHCPESGERRAWRLFLAEYTPSRPAIVKFLEHRNNLPRSEEERKRFYEEASCPRTVEAFSAVDEHDNPVLPEHGRIFATLPTSMLLPMRLHLQADWLLTVNRGDVAHLEHNQWHAEIREQVPKLIAAYLSWLTSQQRREGWEQGYDAVPDLSRKGSDEEVWLLHPDFRHGLRAELSRLRFLPSVVPGRFLSPAEGHFAPEGFRELEDPAWHPDLLLGRSAVARGRVTERLQNLLHALDLVQATPPESLHQHWGESGVARWVESLPKARRSTGLLRLLEALARAAQEDEDWASTPFVCLPTEAGTWSSRHSLRRLPPDWNFLLGESGLVDQLRALAEADGDLLAWRFWVQLRNASDRYWSARKYLEQIPAIELAELVRRWWDALPRNPSDEQVQAALQLTWWAAKTDSRRQHVHKLLCRGRQGELLLLPSGETLLAAPYGPAYRRRFYPDLPAVAEHYVQQDPNHRSVDWWAGFLSQLPSPPKGPFRLEMRWLTHLRRELEQQYDIQLRRTRTDNLEVEHPVIGRVSHRWYYVLNPALPPNWPDDPSPSVDWFRDAVRWLSEGEHELRRYARPHVVYIPERSRALVEEDLPATPAWAEHLNQRKWVPVRGQGIVRKPDEVLLSYDPARPDAPVADLPSGLGTVLVEAGVAFGTSVPPAPKFLRLQVEGPTANYERLLNLLTEAIAEAEADAEADKALRRLLHTTPLLPGSPDEPDRRVVHGRIVQRAGRGALRSDFGGYVIAVEGFAEGSDARAVLEVVQGYMPFPETTTSHQALDYLRWVWAHGPDAEGVRRYLPLAYAYVMAEIDADVDLRRAWDEALPHARVFVRQVGWVSATEAYLNDLPWSQQLPPALLADYPITSHAHLGATDAERQRVADLLKVRRLSAVFRVISSLAGIAPLPDPWRQRLLALRGVGAEIRRRPLLQEEPELEDEAAEGDVPELSLPPVFRASVLETVVYENGQERLRHPASALYDGERLIVCGEPDEFAAELAGILERLWLVPPRLRLGSYLAVALSALDDQARFARALKQLRGKYGLDAVSPEGEQEVAASAGDLTVEDEPVGPDGEPVNQQQGVRDERPAAEQPEVRDEAPVAQQQETDAEQPAAEQRKTRGEMPASAQLKPIDQEPARERHVNPKDGQAPTGNVAQRRPRGPEDQGHGPRRPAEAGGGRPPARNGSYTAQNVDAEVQKLLAAIRHLRTAGAVPRTEPDPEPDGEAGPAADAEYREAVIRYEAAHGRRAVPGSPTQVGFDLESFAADGRLVRRIEVKGRSGPWTGAELITLSRRQFAIAQEHDPAVGWDYWLYVVQREGGGYRVLPIRNPAQAAGRFEFRAGTWLDAVEEEGFVGQPEEPDTPPEDLWDDEE